METILINQQDIDFSDMTKIGRVEIEISPQTDNLNILIQGFRFSSENTDLIEKLKVLSWAKSVIETELAQKSLYQNGDVVLTSGRVICECGPSE